MSLYHKHTFINIYLYHKHTFINMSLYHKHTFINMSLRFIILVASKNWETRTENKIQGQTLFHL